jgi:hypothetical protein
VSFYVPGQFGDALFSITRAQTDGSGRLWISDFLSGRVFVISESNRAIRAMSDDSDDTHP